MSMKLIPETRDNLRQPFRSLRTRLGLNKRSRCKLLAYVVRWTITAQISDASHPT